MEDNTVLSDTSTVNRSGGVEIAADAVHVAGDVVGRDKITNVYQIPPTFEIKPPPEPARPPETPGFVGRETELIYFTQQLATRHLAVISGMPGAGKTALAAMLARRIHEPEQTFWHEFHHDETVTSIVWKLAGFLERHGQADLWQMLNRAHQTGGQAPPPAVLIDYLFPMLRGHDYLLCFDDFEFVVDDPLLEQFVARLQPALAAGELSMIIASQRIPSFLYTDDFAPLEGLSLEDTRRLLIQRGLKLDGDEAQVTSAKFDSLVLTGMKFVYPPDFVENLHARTEGNALFLTLAADRLIHSANPASFLTRLLSDTHVEQFLVKEIDERLTDSERAVLNAIAVLLGYPGTRAAVEAMLDGQNVHRDLNHLSERYLLRVSKSEVGREFSLNSVVRAFYYDELTKRERQAMHRRAAEFYEVEEVEPIRAALHFEAAGEAEQSAQLATANLSLAISCGQGRLVQLLLTRLTEAQLSSASQIAVGEARGDLHYLLGELDEARDEYEVAQHKTNDVLTSVRLLRKTSEILARKGEPEQALENLARGHELLKQVATQNNDEAGPLAVVYGTVILNLGRYDDAATETQTALAHLSKQANPTIAANLHDVLGKVYFFKGELALSLEQFQIALDLRRSAFEQNALIKSYSNLAVVYGHQRRYADALQANQAALEIAEHIGDIVALGRLYNNMAADAANQGDYDQAIEFHTHSLALHKKMGDLQGLALAHRNLGDVYRHLDNYELATEHILQAIESTRQASDEGTIIASVVALAETYFSQRRLEEALACCLESVDQAERIHNAFWRPVSLQFMGRIYHSMRHRTEARVCFEEASQIWREREAWIDLGNTLLVWAKLEQDDAQFTRASELCAQASAVAEDSQMDDLLMQTATLQAGLTAPPTKEEEAR